MFHVRRLITKTNSFSPLLKFPLNQANFYSNTAEQANSAINLSDSCVKVPKYQIFLLRNKNFHFSFYLIKSV